MLLLLVIATIYDNRTGKIPNKLILVGWSWGLASLIYQYGVSGILVFFAHGAIPILFFFILFQMHALGAGDIKLFSVLCVVSSWEQWAVCVIVTLVAGGVISLVRLIQKGLHSTIHFSIAILVGYGVSVFFYDYISEAIF